MTTNPHPTGSSSGTGNPPGFGAGVDNSGAGLRNPYASQGLNPSGLAAFAMPSAQADQAQNQQAGYSATLERLSTPPAESSGGQSPNVWVTVPVDKVTVAQGSGTLTQPQEPRQGPTYQNQEGYQQQQPSYPQMAGNTIPPTPAAGKVSAR